MIIKKASFTSKFALQVRLVNYGFISYCFNFSPLKGTIFHILSKRRRFLLTLNAFETGCSRSRPLSATSAAHIAPKRQALTKFDKLRIIDIYHEKKRYLSQQAIVDLLRGAGYLKIHQSTLSRLVKEGSAIRAQVAANARLLNYKRQPVVVIPEIDAALTMWITQKLEHNIRLSGDNICRKARSFCRLFGFPEEILVFSHGWLDSFKSRIGLSSFVFHGEAASASPEHIQAERLRLQAVIWLYAPWDVYSIDETGLFYKLVTN